MRWIVVTSSIVLFGLTSHSMTWAGDLGAPQKDPLEEIRATATEICYTVDQKGRQTDSAVSGKVQAKLDGFMAKVADAGIEAGAQHGSKEYQGILQSDLAAALKDAANCRKEVFFKLVEKMLPATPPVKELNEPQVSPPEQSKAPKDKVLPNVASRVPVPSFPCSKTSNAVETLICANADLAELDVKLNNAYHASLKQLPPAGQQRLTREQSGWHKQRDACKPSSDMAACVERAYWNRLSALGEPAPPPRGAGPNFPCSQALSAVERLICANAGLAELDVKLSDTYHASLKQLPPAGQPRLTRDQFDWRQQRDACEHYGDMAACVERAYRNRLSALGAD